MYHLIKLFFELKIIIIYYWFHKNNNVTMSDDAEKITSEPHGSRTLETTPTQQKEKTS